MCGWGNINFDVSIVHPSMSDNADEAPAPAADPEAAAAPAPNPPSEREQVLDQYRRKIREHREIEARLKRMREDVRGLVARYQKTEDDLQALQSVGQIIGDVLKRIDADRFIVKASQRAAVRRGRAAPSSTRRSSSQRHARGPRHDHPHNHASASPRGGPAVFHMQSNEVTRSTGRRSLPPSAASASRSGSYGRSIELPLMNPELFLRVGIAPPKGVLLYGPPGTGKTLLAKAIASNIDANFLKVVSSAIVDKYIGESARLIREMFGFAREHEPCVIFMDEIDAIGGKRFSEGTSADREIQRTLMELLNQMDGFEVLGQVKMVMATNRPDVLDPALMRPGRLDRKIEIPLPNEGGRVEILKIHAQKINKHGDVDYEAISKIADDFNAADMRNICTEAGMFAIRDDRDYCLEEDFMKAARKILDTKKLESKLDYSKV